MYLLRWDSMARIQIRSSMRFASVCLKGETSRSARTESESGRGRVGSQTEVREGGRYMRCHWPRMICEDACAISVQAFLPYKRWPDTINYFERS